jgi:thymidylate kinase
VHGNLTHSLARYAVVVLEGCDGTGKTSLATALARGYDFRVVHSSRTPDRTDLTDRYSNLIAEPGNIVLDRSFISELVYGPLDHGHSRLTLADAIDLATRVSQRGGILVHLTGSPGIIAARLRARDGTAASAERLRAIIDAYHRTFALLQGAAPIITADTTKPQP